MTATATKPPEIADLYLADGKKAGVRFCTGCKLVMRPDDVECFHCQPKLCKECGKERTSSYIYCDPCRRDRKAKEELERYQAAEVVEPQDVPGMVYLERYGPEFFQDVNDLLDYVACDRDEGHDPPEYAWVCAADPFPGFPVSCGLQLMAEDMFDDATDQLEGLDELQKAVEAFDAANADLKTWRPDYKRVVLIPREPTADGDDHPLEE